jgi:uncharacterized protein (TIRG00374 family)
MSRRWYVYVPIGLAILALLVWRTRPWEALDAVGRASLGWLLLALALDGLVIAAWTARSQRLLRALGHPIPLSQLAPIAVFANTVAAVTPASLGEALRAMVLKRRHGVPYRVGAAVILIERLVSLYLLAVWTAAAIVALSLSPSSRLPAALLTGGLATLVPLAVARSGVSLAGPARRLAAWTPIGRARMHRLADSLGDVENLVRQILGEARELAWFGLWTAAVFGATTIQVWAVSVALGGSVDPLAAWAALGSGSLAGILSALPFGLGAADAVLVVGLVSAGLAPPLATLVALVLRVVNNVPTALLGSLCFVLLSRAPEDEAG